jgi:hypothetical protein
MVSPAAKNTGGVNQAESDEARLISAFPGSPMMGTGATYNAEEVSKYKYKILTNTVDASDLADAAGYWGFTTPESEPTVGQASSADLKWSGAPDLDENLDKDSADKKLASNYMPNLVTPPIDAPTTEVENTATTTPSDPPGVGNGLANPRQTSTAIQEHIVESQKDANTPIPGGPTAEGAAGGDHVRVPST